MAVLQGPSRKQADLIAQELGEAPGDIERGVRDLRSMLAASPYLPEPENLGMSDKKWLFTKKQSIFIDLVAYRYL